MTFRCLCLLFLSPQNVANGPKRRRGGWASSPFKGVARYKAGGRRQAGICHDHRRFHLGVYLTEIEAAVAYDHAARLLFGAFARPNNIPAARRMVIEQDVERRLARVGRAA